MATTLAPAFINFLVTFPPIKIDRSERVDKRLYSLQTANPYKLYLLGTVPIKSSSNLETNLHKFFAKYRMRGEWFRPDRCLLDTILNLINDRV